MHVTQDEGVPKLIYTTTCNLFLPQMKWPVVNGVSCVTYYAHDHELVDNAVRFYTNYLGLTIHSETDNGVYLASDDSLLVLKLVVSKEAPDSAEVKKIHKRFEEDLNIVDWRSRAPGFTLSIADLNSTILKLQQAGLVLQITPNDLYPNEAYFIDPLGNLVGLTTTANPLSLVPPVKKLDQPNEGYIMSATI